MTGKMAILKGMVGVCMLSLVAGCASMSYKSSTVGGKTTWKKTEVVDGKTVVTGDAATMKKEKARQQAQADRIERIKKAEKRKPNEPIIVALFRPVIAENLKKSIKPDKLFKQLRTAFEKDPAIKLVDQKKVDEAKKQADRKFGRKKKRPQVSADISVFTNVMAKQVAGISKSSGKVASMAAIVFKGSITSHWLAEEEKIEEMGNIFRNIKITKKYAAKAVSVMKTKITIPGEAFKKSEQNQKKQMFMNLLKGLGK
ncbi:hypothetical protein KAR34_10845 [bacterium]|nr:hypothetical protein [bacterium]